MSPTPILQRLGGDRSDDALLGGFIDHTVDAGIEMYPAQEEAIIEIIGGNNVIVNTPTGSGKSLIAAAAHFVAIGRHQRSVYTAPIKALVSEKFFELCSTFGSDQVGMVTGDGSVNADAPIICCTAEILANRALRDGAATEVDVVIADEFHFYADPQRGWAWQVPLLELPHAQFILMSATLGSTAFFERDLTARTGRPTTLVSSAQRPVPLSFEYRTSTLHRSVEELLESGRAPIYLVHFTQREATEAAQGYLSLDPLTKAEKQQAKELIGGFRFDSPFGKSLRRFLVGGVGVHHAGLLPKYRLLVERMAQAGLLKIICGTDTLGVGVNVPIRSVLFTKLCKYDGSSVRILRVREFQQIAGRAGRRGFDDRGDVWVQAPEHVVENRRLTSAAENDAKKRKKLVKKKPPERGYAHWSEDTYDKLVNGQPEALTSSFEVNHQMVMSLLDRPRSPVHGDGCAAVRRLMTDNHEPRRRQRQHIRRSIAIYRSLVDAGLLEFPDPPDDLGRRVRVDFDLQDEFALHQPLSLWALEAIEHLDRALRDEDTAGQVERSLAVLTIIEAVQESPAVVIAAQLRRVKDELMAEMKASGIEYEERMERLAAAEPPRPLKDWMYDDFNTFRTKHPWVGGDTVKPKSVARDLFERAMTFGEYVDFYGLKQSEGALLRYLSDVYKGLVQNVPADARNDELDEITHWLGTLVRRVDSSLLDEWERLQNPDDTDDRVDDLRPPVVDDVDITTDARSFRTMVRNAAFGWIEAIARRKRPDVTDPDLDLGAELAAYWDEYGEILTDGDARAAARFSFDAASGTVEQTIHDPDGHDEWRLTGSVDLAASAAENRLVVTLTGVVRR